MLIDEFLPVYDFEETHDIRIKADAASVYRAIIEVDFAESFIVRWLLRLRGMTSDGVKLSNLRKFKFEKLAENANKELLIGLAGRFWSPWGDLQTINADNFCEFDKKGYAKAVWNFSLRPTANETHLTTETRIKCIDAASLRGFGLYWSFIQPFSGLIRMEMLKMIKRKAELH